MSSAAAAALPFLRQSSCRLGLVARTTPRHPLLHAVPSRAAVTATVTSIRSLSSTRSVRASALRRSSSLDESEVGALRADAERLWGSIHSTAAAWGTGKRYGDAAEATGMTRL